MTTGRFQYKVEIEIEFTGLDLIVLEYHAKKHYDGTCQRFFEPTEYRTVEGFSVPVSQEREGSYWRHEWAWQDWKARFGHIEDKKVDDDEYRHPSENLEFAVKVEASSRTLDLCMKIIERLGVDENWELIGELMGRKMPEIEQKMSVLVLPLRLKLKQAFHAIEKEWVRLNDAQEPAPPFEGKLECPRCKGSNLLWQEYVCHTRGISLATAGENVANIDSNDEKVEFEDCKDESLYCKDCLAAFPLPANLNIDHV